MLKVDLSFVKKIINVNSTDIEEEIILSDKSALQMHKSFGNIADFQFSKNSIFIVESKQSID